MDRAPVVVRVEEEGSEEEEEEVEMVRLER